MKKTVLLFCSCLCFLCFCQNYHFDYVLKYNETFEEENEKWIDEAIISSKDQTYRMSISNSGQTITATLSDYKNEIQHVFEITNPNFPLTEKNFVYKYSVKFKIKKQIEEEKTEKRIYKQEIIETTENSKKIKIEAFKNERSNRPLSTYYITLIPYSDDLWSYGLGSLTDSFELYKRIGDFGNYILSEGEAHFDKRVRSMKLDYFEPVNVNFDIKENQIKYR